MEIPATRVQAMTIPPTRIRRFDLGWTPIAAGLLCFVCLIAVTVLIISETKKYAAQREIDHNGCVMYPNAEPCVQPCHDYPALCLIPDRP